MIQISFLMFLPDFDHNINPSHLLVAGDMNVALGPLDYRGSRPTHSNINFCNALNSLIDEFNILDVEKRAS